MICQICGNKIPDDSQFCNKCGIAIEHDNPENLAGNITEASNRVVIEELSEKKSKPNKRKIAILTILLTIGFIAIGLGIYLLVPFSKYSQAVNLQNQQKYEDAIQAFKDLNSYGDSDKHIAECLYQEGEASFKNGNFEDAIGKYKEAQIAGYSNIQDKVFESQYALGKQLLDKKEYTNAINYFRLLGSYKDSKDLLNLTLCFDGKANYTAGNFDKAEEELKECKLDSNTLALAKTVKAYQGTWQQNDNRYTQLVISGWKISVVFSPDTNKSKSFDYTYTFHGGDKIYTTQESTYLGVDTNGLLSNQTMSVDYVLKDNILQSNDPIDDFSYLQKTGEYKYKTYKKIGNSTAKPLDGYEPAVGMDAEKARQSTWGSPEKINKTTMAYGVHEQWVYSGNRYIYVDDGIVTAIQN